jgi:hypothetical protein
MIGIIILKFGLVTIWILVFINKSSNNLLMFVKYDILSHE